jgi:hypothetical protein
MRHGIAIQTGGTVAAWGGQPDPFAPFPALTEPYGGQADVPTGLANVIDVAGGYFHSIALISNSANLWPNVYITSPTNNTTFGGTTDVLITATASDWDGTVTNVQFYAGGALIGADSTSPYSMTWSNVPLGTYTLTARATDNLGGTKLSAPVVISVNTSFGGLADSYVYDGQATSNFGTATNLQVRTSSSGNNRDAYFKFDLTNYTGITGARLRFWAKLDGSGSVGTTAYAVTNTTWTEGGITWNNKPGITNAMGSVTVSGSSFAWYEVDVSSHVMAEKAAGRSVISLALHNPSTSTRMIQINSKEASVNKPELVLTSTNVAPTISITAPANNTVFAAPSNIPITASASDPDGSIANVEFFAGTTSLGVDASSPFSLTWSNVSSGAYSLTARATDNLGTVRTSAVVAVIADTPPAIALTAPTNNALFVEPANVSLSVTASDSDGSVSKVEYYAGTNKVAEATNSPFSATWTSAPSGLYSLTAKATDNLGISTTSSAVNITIFPTLTNAALMRLGYWRFDDTNWLGEKGQTPIVATNIQNVSGTISNAVQVNSTNMALLKYREVEFSHSANIDVRNGSAVFWFKPAWSSASAGGSGPGALGHLISLGQLTTNASVGCWTLSVAADGTALSLITQTNGASVTNFNATISWTSNQWHQIGLVYTPSNSALYIDGQPVVTNGLGVTVYPNAVTRAADGFSVGSDRAGTAQAKGLFDALETFNYPLTAVEISQRPDSDGDGLPDGWETLYGLDPDDPTGNDGANGDPDEDGLLNIEEWIFGTNPNSHDLPGGGTGAIHIHTPLE